MPSPAEREKALFRAAAELTPGVARRAFLDQACAGDVALRARLDALLAAHDEPDQLLAAPVPAVKATMKVEFADDQPDEAVGQMLGRYKLLERVGEGGCGVVYVAEQTEPVRRRVALKVIKLGMDTKQVVARFEAERQALAMMDHPNIAKVLDAGSTETGRPYFVMELVRGIKITEYCDQNNLPTKERLDLFIRVCQAIQHAHQKGIIHRDIKPSNILVTLHDGLPVPKVIDFGIAKATEGRLTDATVYTQLHQFIGTPAYMSPEQAEMSGLDIDTRSDIYSLGVLLYELLTGKTPFDAQELMSQGIDAMRKTIREKDPVRPSTRLATLQGDELTTTAKRRSVETSKLARLLRGDLDWIVMKCLEKDRTRRYETANGIAADLKRHLNNEPVAARPPSTAYRFQKLVRRNKLVFAAAGAVVCALLLGIIATTWQAVRAKQAAAQAKRAGAMALQSRGEAEKLANFMLEDFYDDLEPSGQFTTIARLAKQAVAYYDGLPPSLRTPDTERNRAMAQARLALVTAKQGDGKTALPVAKEAEATLERVRKLGDQSDGTIFALGLALEAQAWCHRLQNDKPSQAGPLERGTQILRPFAVSVDGSKRVKLEYANLLNFLGLIQPSEQGTVTCDEALRILAGMGALELKDLDAASAWADIADSESRGMLAIGRADEAERLEKQVRSLAEGVLVRRPGNLRARLDLVFASDVLALIEAARFHEDDALRLATQSQQSAEEYMRFNPSDINGWNMLAAEDYSIASLLFRRGRTGEALQNAQSAIKVELDYFNNRGASPFMNVAPWLAVVEWEAQQGHRDAAEQALQEMRRFLATHPGEGPFPGISQKDSDEVWNEVAERRMRLAFGEYATAFTMATNALPLLHQVAETAAANKFTRDYASVCVRYQRQALDDAVTSALALGRYAEAEALAQTMFSIAAEKPGSGFESELVWRISLEQPDDRMWAKVLLAQAKVGPDRKEEALRTLEPALAQYRLMQSQGATDLRFRWHFARALYVKSLAEPSDAGGLARRREELNEAERLLQGLTEEARQLHDSKELLSWIAAEQRKLKDAPEP